MENEPKDTHSQFTQITMNLLSNAHDILKIKDSGGGIPVDIIDRVFEPYFTTKHKAQRTGIALYLSVEIDGTSV